MRRYNIDCTGITHEEKGKGKIPPSRGHWLLRSGVSKETWEKEEVGWIVNEKYIDRIINEEYIKERILVAELKHLEEEKWTLIVTYAPNEDAKKKRDKVYIL